MIASMTALRARIGLLDVALTGVFVAISFPYMISEVGDDKIDASAWAVAPFAAIMIPMLWRRRAPLVALGGMVGLLLLHAAIFGDLVRCGIVIPAMLVLAYAAAAGLDARDAFIGLGLALAIGATICLTDGKEGAQPEDLLFVAPVVLAIWAVGRVVHSRARLVSNLQARTAELEVTRSERARLEVATERGRLSAELEALLQRRLGELAQLAERQADAYGDAAVDALAEIEVRSRETLEEMRSIVGVLRDDGANAPRAPQPTLTHLEALLLRAKGANARLTVDGNPRVLPAAVELSAYRIVAQLLGPPADAPGVEVHVHFDDAALELAVSGPALGRVDEALERARERAALHAGTLRTTVSAGRAEARVSLPLLAAV